MPAPETIVKLVAKFETNRESYRSGKYNEAQLRLEFLDPFFEALGWDVHNHAGVAPDYREVVIEQSTEIEGGAKKPDYTFRIGQTPKFYVEAKKPKVDIQYDIHPAYQLRRYAWNKRLPLSILTDFEELAIYNCKARPNPGDSAATGREKFYRYTEYLEKWDEIAGIFSREAVWKGAFDRFAETTKGKKGTTEVDDEFLKDIEAWRIKLARNIALRNPQIADESQLNYAVQMTIDRILFLRICEDRGIEPEGHLQALAQSANIYPALVGLFKQADAKYNSGLFHFGKEKANDSPADTFTPTLTVDDRVLKEIITSIYYPCPYIFREIPVEILGQVYEQFLGKVIRLTPGHQAKIEEKPEVRKAGGVYYTPQYIVDYIVKNTVGKLLEGKTPAEAAQLKIVDPACGSGSFLLGAYQYLLDWHLDWYTAHEPEQWGRAKNPPVLPASGGGWKLTTARRKEILVNSIHGVDIDAQAVEVTKLSLLLKVLEEETGQGELGFERALPDLGRNIQCGNSLIGEDYFAGRLVVDEAERRRVNPFEWRRAFPQVFARGGFDAVIGNPPYLNIDDTWGKADPQRVGIKRLFPEIYNDKSDILFYFIGKSITLSKGYVSFIVSRAFLEAYKADKLRGFILRRCKIQEIIDFKNYSIFPGVGISTCIINLMSNKTGSSFFVYKLADEKRSLTNLEELLDHEDVFEKIEIDQGILDDQAWNFASHTNEALNRKIDSTHVKLGELMFIGKGMETGCNDVFGRKSFNDIKEWTLSSGQYYKRASNSDIQRYVIRNRDEFIIYPQAFKKFQDMPIKLREYLSSHSAELKNRAAYKRGNCEWWKYTWPLHEKYYDRKRIICPFLSSINRFALDDKKEYLSLTDSTVIFDNNQKEDILYILGLLNSKLLTFRFRSIGKLKGGGVLEYFWNSISKLPIRTVNFSDPADVKRHERMVALVERMLSLHRRVAAAETSQVSKTCEVLTPLTPQEQERLAREIEATDREIDALVYELYGLTEEEIRIVEGG